MTTRHEDYQYRQNVTGNIDDDQSGIDLTGIRDPTTIDCSETLSRQYSILSIHTMNTEFADELDAVETCWQYKQRCHHSNILHMTRIATDWTYFLISSRIPHAMIHKALIRFSEEHSGHMSVMEGSDTGMSVFPTRTSIDTGKRTETEFFSYQDIIETVLSTLQQYPMLSDADTNTDDDMSDIDVGSINWVMASFTMDVTYTAIASPKSNNNTTVNPSLQSSFSLFSDAEIFQMLTGSNMAVKRHTQQQGLSYSWALVTKLSHTLHNIDTIYYNAWRVFTRVIVTILTTQ